MKTTYDKTLIAEICNRILEGNEPVVSLSREYGISQNTMYSWMSKYRKGKMKLYQNEQTAELNRLRQENGTLLETVENLKIELAQLRENEKNGLREVFHAGCASHIILKPCDSLYVIQSGCCTFRGYSKDREDNNCPHCGGAS